jgi:hypothetical protein
MIGNGFEISGGHLQCHSMVNTMKNDFTSEKTFRLSHYLLVRRRNIYYCDILTYYRNIYYATRNNCYYDVSNNRLEPI